LVLLCACGSEAKKEETPAPPALTTADLAGSFTGTSMAATSDSVVGTWTSSVMIDSAGAAQGRFVSASNPKDTVSFTQRIEGDSVISESAPYTDAAMPKGSPQVHWKAIGRGMGSEWSGTVDIMPVGKDTVITHLRWKSTRTP
jgi:hypothetical protein